MNFEARVAGALIGGAIGDAMGAPVEGWNAPRILAWLSTWDFTKFMPPYQWDGQNPFGKGNGHITDDTLMTEALIDAYAATGAHLDAYGYAKHILPRIVTKEVWVPERQTLMPVYERLWWPEKFPRFRLEINNAEPRTAGVGNCVNCGVAMWIMPVGAVNAGDVWGAYQEAASIGSAHNESFAVEAAAVLAAAHAAAFSGSDIAGVLDAALRYAQDGTAKAIHAVLPASAIGDPLPTWIDKVRAAVAPFDQRETHASDDHPLAIPTTLTDLGRPSRTKSIEELPVALAALHYGNGDFIKTMRAAVCYGRDCDSIAGMACGLYGAIYGLEALPPSLVKDVDTANRRDFAAIARTLAAAAKRIYAGDVKHQAVRANAIGS